VLPQATGFVLTGIVLDKYHHVWIQYILKILGTASIWARFSKRVDEHPHALPASDAEKRNNSGVSEMTKNFFLIIISPFTHCWFSTKREIWKAKRTLKIFRMWWKEPAEMSQMDRMERKIEKELGNGQDPEPSKCICKMCVSHPSDDAKDPSEKEKMGTMAVKTHIRQLVLDYWLINENLKSRTEILPQSRQCKSPVNLTSSSPEIPVASTGESGTQLPIDLPRANTPQITNFSRPRRPTTISSTAPGFTAGNQ